VQHPPPATTLVDAGKQARRNNGRHTRASEQAIRKVVVPQVAEGVDLPVGAVTVAGLVIWEADGSSGHFPQPPGGRPPG
jgi:hypothetical protein